MTDTIKGLLGDLHHPSLQPIDLSLDRIRVFLARLGSPEQRLPPVIHVAGTNGKGSLLAYLSAMFAAAGIRTHRYTSPHLVRFNERIVVGGKEISDDALAPLLERVAKEARAVPVTFFEATTAAAFLAFAEYPAEVCLLETGLGGRFDATNVVEKPLLTAITPVSFDHTEYLGDTLTAIAGEKAGILKPGVPCVVGPQWPEALAVIEEAAAMLRAPLARFGMEWRMVEDRGEPCYISPQRRLSLAPNLPGGHQIHNAATAVACAEMLPGLRLTSAQMAHGIQHAQWPARLQRLQGGRLSSLLPAGVALWLDGGHNPDAGEALAAWARGRPQKLTLVCGMIRGKDSAGFLRPLAPFTRRLIAIDIPGEGLSQKAEVIQQTARGVGMEAAVAGSMAQALDMVAAEHTEGGEVLMCGSLYLAGRVLAAELAP